MYNTSQYIYFSGTWGTAGNTVWNNKQAADTTDTPYEEGFDDKESKAVIKYRRNVARSKAELAKLNIKPDTPQEDMPERSMIVGDDSEDEVMEMVEENIEEIAKEKPMGLMSKEMV